MSQLQIETSRAVESPGVKAANRDVGALALREVSARFGTTIAVDNLSLEVESGRLVALLGPSGCGKTTTLRMIAGFVTPATGEILLNGRIVNDVPVYRRNIGMVFQQYALFPHLNVFDNIAYGLRERKVGREEIGRRVPVAMEMVGLKGLGERRTRELSGGQQQRVALARALIIDPSLLLLDEPLSNLDAKLRLQVRAELRKLHRRLGVTMLFVTHDQEEALSMAETVVVMNRGRIEQIGTPEEIYQRPATAFVADFIGGCNLVKAEVVESHSDGVVCRASGASVAVTLDHSAPPTAHGEATLSVRPERLRLLPNVDGTVIEGPTMWSGRVSSTTYLGARTEYEIITDRGIHLTCEALNEGGQPFAPERPVLITWDAQAWRMLR